MQLPSLLQIFLPSLFLLQCLLHPAEAYSPLDPTGNVTVVWDIIKVTSKTTYTVNVTLDNLQLFQQVTNWSLTWTWPGEEYITEARGAEATEQGDCRSMILNNNTDPHCCLKSPTMIDMAPTENPPIPGCCRNGTLNNLLLKPKPTAAVFQLDVSNSELDSEGAIPPPQGLRLLHVDYTCTPPFLVPPTKHTSPGSKRIVESYATWNVLCSYRKADNKPPPCCVSFSAFYSPTIVPCPRCSCACGSFSQSSALCFKGEIPGTKVPFLIDAQSVPDATTRNDSIVCSPDGCPVHIRFHLKDNYKGYWRGKVTIFNREFQNNHTDWHLALQHPNVGSILEVFSFNSTFVQPYGVNNTVAFSGKVGHNEWLVSANNKSGPGVVFSEILFQKNSDFSLAEGWPFPRRIMFQGAECTMPKEFPPLPNEKPMATVVAS